MIPAAAANAAAIAAMRRISARSDRKLAGIGPAASGGEDSGDLPPTVVLLFSQDFMSLPNNDNRGDSTRMSGTMIRAVTPAAALAQTGPTTSPSWP